MSNVLALRCRQCGAQYPESPQYVCEECFGPLEAVYDYDAIARTISRAQIESGPRSVWRYQALLPADRQPRIDLGAGFTPLVKADQLGKRLGLNNLYIKNDSVNPTFSFKDRVVAMASAKAVEFGFTALACASTGNLAASVSAHAAKAGMPAYVFVPADLEPAKIVNASVYGATIVAIDGNYDAANRLATEVGDEYGWAFVNINMRPYYSEGSKTLAFEVAEQLGWRAPDRVFAPIASGSLYTKIWKGFHELQMVGLIDGVATKMVGAQAQGCSPVAVAYANGAGHVEPVKPNTIAKSLAIGAPADGYYALKVARESGGSIEWVTEDAIGEGMQLLASTEGIFAETAGGVTIAALKKLAEARALDPDELIVAYITGNGLKTQEAVTPLLAQPLYIMPTMRAFQAAMARV
ncbi:MAG: threonine synthase [Chloroflexota bacterium]